ncbi:hypothetical protein LJC10_05825 [Selenomonadales bacterium OttesenSCG-928-I06]|nr:hypothetical protein [Selenomonadales bacterium OttesenSCG-928-I06]
MKQIKILAILTLILLIGTTIILAAPKQAELTPGGQKSKTVYFDQDNYGTFYLIEEQIINCQKNTPTDFTLIIICEPTKEYNKELGQVLITEPKVTKYLDVTKETVWASAYEVSYTEKTNTIQYTNFIFYNHKGQIIGDMKQALQEKPASPKNLDKNPETQKLYDKLTNFISTYNK